MKKGNEVKCDAQCLNSSEITRYEQIVELRTMNEQPLTNFNSIKFAHKFARVGINQSLVLKTGVAGIV